MTNLIFSIITTTLMYSAPLVFGALGWRAPMVSFGRTTGRSSGGAGGGSAWACLGGAGSFVGTAGPSHFGAFVDSDLGGLNGGDSEAFVGSGLDGLNGGDSEAFVGSDLGGLNGGDSEAFVGSDLGGLNGGDSEAFVDSDLGELNGGGSEAFVGSDLDGLSCHRSAGGGAAALFNNTGLGLFGSSAEIFGRAFGARPDGEGGGAPTKAIPSLINKFYKRGVNLD